MIQIALARVLLVFAFAATMVTSSAKGATYDVNRSITDGIRIANLVGTLDVPFGNYTIQSASASPFTDVDLVLTVNTASYHLVNVFTDLVQGTGQFIIDATPTGLTFATANANDLNPADLVFSDAMGSAANNRYVIGSNGVPAFQAAYTNTGTVVASATFPTVFGTVIPLNPDFDMDGDVDGADVDLLVMEIVGMTHGSIFDLTGDGTVSHADLVAWLGQAGAINLPSGNPYLFGDANLDGFVDGSDFGVWNANKFTMNAKWTLGDFNADGFIDGSDFGTWNANKFTSADSSSQVPEPSGCLACAAGILLLVGRRLGN